MGENFGQTYFLVGKTSDMLFSTPFAILGMIPYQVKVGKLSYGRYSIC